MKYLAYISISIKKEVSYKENIIGLWLAVFFGLLIQIKLWETIYSENDMVNNTAFGNLFVYFIFGMLFTRILYGGISSIVSTDYRSGNIAVEMVKPQSYSLKLISQDIGRGLIQICVVAIVVLIFCFLYRMYIPQYSIFVFVYTFLSAIIGYFINFMIEYCVGLLSIWLGTSVGVEMVKSSLFAFCGGVMIPLSFYPDLIGKVMDFLPFKYIYYIPLSYLLSENNIKFFFRNTIVQLMWFAISLVAAMAMKRIAKQKISIQGG